MAWEQRGNQTYYYRSVRVGRRVVKEYGGGGFMGVLAAEFDAEQREERANKRGQIQRERARWAALEQPARELDDLSEQLLAATLVMAGYHRHDRGEWRRWRG